MVRGRKLAVAAVAFALAAAVSSWNPIAAPFGLLLGVAAAFLSIRAFRLGARRAVAGVALAISILAVVGSGIVLAVTAGVGREPTGEPVVSGATGDAAGRVLDEEEARTRDARARAREELGKVGGDAPAPAHDAKAPAHKEARGPR
jgi:hypothetical protein